MSEWLKYEGDQPLIDETETERGIAHQQIAGAVSALEKMIAVADLEATGDDTLAATWVAAEARKVLARLGAQ